MNVNVFVHVLNPASSNVCLFCGEIETLFHVFIECARLDFLFTFLSQVFACFREVFSEVTFIFGPGYKDKQRKMAATQFCSGGGEAGHIPQQEVQGGRPGRPGTSSTFGVTAGPPRRHAASLSRRSRQSLPCPEFPDCFSPASSRRLRRSPGGSPQGWGPVMAHPPLASTPLSLLLRDTQQRHLGPGRFAPATGRSRLPLLRRSCPPGRLPHHRSDPTPPLSCLRGAAMTRQTTRLAAPAPDRQSTLPYKSLVRAPLGARSLHKTAGGKVETMLVCCPSVG